MKRLFYFLLCLAPCLLYSQTEPQWGLPLCFEDANGERDTVYIGYDPSAESNQDFDEEFEDYLWIDTSKFNVVIDRLHSYSPTTGLYNPDSCKKIEVSSTYNFASFVNFIKGQMPITMSWDMSLFYSSDLPYPDNFPYPNAVAYVFCGAGEPGYVNCPSAFDDDPLSITDQPNPSYVYPITSPHLFDGTGLAPLFDEPEKVLSLFQINFSPYDIYTDILFIDNMNKILIYPNPFNDYINIRSTEKYSSLLIHDLMGQVIYQNDNSNYEVHIYTSDIPSGIYLLSISLKETTYIQKIIKP